MKKKVEKWVKIEKKCHGESGDNEYVSWWSTERYKPISWHPSAVSPKELNIFFWFSFPTVVKYFGDFIHQNWLRILPHLRNKFQGLYSQLWPWMGVQGKMEPNPWVFLASIWRQNNKEKNQKPKSTTIIDRFPQVCTGKSGGGVTPHQSGGWSTPPPPTPP